MRTQKPAANAQKPQPTDNPAAEPTPAEPNPEPSTPEPTDAAAIEARIQAALDAERQRVAAIQARCTEVGKPELAAALIDSGADMAACNAAIIDAWVAQGGPEIRQHTTQTAQSSSAAVQEIQRKIFAQISGAAN